MRAYTHWGRAHRQHLTQKKYHIFLCSWKGSNLRSLDLESDALPIEPPRIIIITVPWREDMSAGSGAFNQVCQLWYRGKARLKLTFALMLAIWGDTVFVYTSRVLDEKVLLSVETGEQRFTLFISFYSYLIVLQVHFCSGGKVLIDKSMIARSSFYNDVLLMLVSRWKLRISFRWYRLVLIVVLYWLSLVMITTSF